MTRRRLRLGLAALAVLTPLLFGAASALAYTGEVNDNVVMTLESQGIVKCNKAITIEASVLGPSGTGNPDQTVTWAITGGPAGAKDELSGVTSVTDADGVATIDITLGCKVGSRTVTATAPGGAVGSITIRLRSNGLPNTSTLPATTLGPSPIVPIALVGGLVALLVGGTLALRRRA